MELFTLMTSWLRESSWEDEKVYYNGLNAGKYTGVLAPTPDKITKMGVARTFQNIRLFKELTVFENVLIAKHMNIKANIFSGGADDKQREKLMREETMELLRILGLEKNKVDLSFVAALRQAEAS